MHATTSDTDFLSDVKVVPSDEKVSDESDDEKKVTDEGQSIGEGSDKDSKKSKKDNDKKDYKGSEQDDTETPKDENEKESVEVKSPVINQNNASVSPNVPEQIKPDGSESQIEETGKRNQSNPDTSEEVEKDAEQPDEDESPEENKDMDSQPVTAIDKKITEDENEGEVNQEDEKEEEESDDDLDKPGRMARSTNLAHDMRRRMQPLPGNSREKMTRNAQLADTMEEIRKLQKNPVSV